MSATPFALRTALAARAHRRPPSALICGAFRRSAAAFAAASTTVTAMPTASLNAKTATPSMSPFIASTATASMRGIAVSAPRDATAGDVAADEALLSTLLPTVLKKRLAVAFPSVPPAAWPFLRSVAECAKSTAEKPRPNPLEVQFQRGFSRDIDLLDGCGVAATLDQMWDAAAMVEELTSAAGAGDDEREMAAVAEEEIDALIEKLRDSEDAIVSCVETRVSNADEVATVANTWTLETLGRAGGTEAALFAAELLTTYKDYCTDVRGWSVEDVSPPDAQGGTIRIKGEDVFKYLVHEIGVHRVQRVPVTEASGRMQTSTASVFLLPQPSAVSIDLKDEDVQIEMVRGSGPGGQGVNSSSNAVRLFHKPTGIHISCHQCRSGNNNRQLAMDMLAQKLWKDAYQKHNKAQGSIFASQWTSGERGERIRTYNYQQNRITDHRGAGWELNNLPLFMAGAEAGMGEVHKNLVAAAFKKNALQSLMAERRRALELCGRGDSKKEAAA